MKGKKKSEPQNLRRFRAVIEEFTEQHDGQSSLHGVESGKVKKEKVQSRKNKRKEERKLKKMRKHAFIQRKPLPTADTIAKHKADEAKAEKLKEKNRKKRAKSKEKKKEKRDETVEDTEDVNEPQESNVRAQGLREANKAEDKLIRQLAKQMKLNKRKSKTLPKSFIDDGLDFILDAVDPDKLKEGFEEEKETKSSGWGMGDSDDDSDGINMEGLSDDEDLDSSDAEDVSDDSDEAPEETHVRKSHKQVKLTREENKDDNPKKKSKKTKTVQFSAQPVDPATESDSSSDPMVDDENDDDDYMDDGELKMDIAEDDLDSGDESNDGEYLDELNDGEYLDDLDVNVNDQGSDSSNNDEDNDENTEDNRKTEKKTQKEDIYGRLIDSSGKVVEVKTTGYIPPGKRLQMAANADEKQNLKLERTKRQLKGLINRLSEANLQSIAGQIEAMFGEHSRGEMGEAVTSNMIDSCVLVSLAPETLVMEHMMLIAILHHNIGSEIGAQLVQCIGNMFDDLYNTEIGEASGKKLDNLLIMLSHLFSLKVLHCLLIFDILNKLAENFGQRDIELILVILKNVGFGLRKEDPVALKEFIVVVQGKASAADTSAYVDQSRVKFMLEIILAIKNNNMRKIPNYDTSHLDHLRKLLRNYIRGAQLGGNLLRISLEDLLQADERGRWWLVGSAWSGRELEPINASEATKTSVSVVSGVSAKILEMARKQRMNTDVRRNIFCIIMTSEDFLDAFEKLLRIGLKHREEREIIHVIIDICLQEKAPNQFYSYLAQKFCEYDRRFQMTTQFNIWDKFSEMENLSESQINNLAALLIHLISTKALSLSVFKKIEFAELDKCRVKLIKLVLTSLLTDYPEHISSDVFMRIAPFPKLRTLRDGLKLFLQHFILRNKGKSTAISQTLRARIVTAEKLLNAAEGSSTL